MEQFLEPLVLYAEEFFCHAQALVVVVDWIRQNNDRGLVDLRDRFF
jgi:hypothetical protein